MHLKRQKKCALSLFLRRYIHMHHFMWKTCQNLTVILSELVLVLPLFVGKEGCFSPLIQINILQLRSFNHHLDMKVSCHIIIFFFFFHPPFEKFHVASRRVGIQMCPPLFVFWNKQSRYVIVFYLFLKNYIITGKKVSSLT